jgi:hypothetical protein
VKSFYLVYFSFWIGVDGATQHGGPWFTAERAALHYDWIMEELGGTEVNFPGMSYEDAVVIKQTDREALKRYYDGRGASSHHGVSWRKNRKKWEARIRHNGKIVYLGSFQAEGDAARAYDNYAIHHNNFPELLLTTEKQNDII